MTTATEGAELTRVGPGTPMGELMRQYWIPAAMSSELKADGAPLRLMLLGEKLIALPRQRGPRRRHGPSLPASLRVAVLRPQRGRRPALRLSRLEVRRRRQLRRHAERAAGPGLQGTRCKAKAYPVTERDGVIWVYMGARAEAPPLPEIEATLLPDSELTDHLRAARVQLAAGAGRRHRHLAFRLPARRPASSRTSCRRTASSALHGRRTARPTIT